MIKNILRFMLLLIFCIFVITACNISDSSSQNAGSHYINQVKNDLDYLTSDICGGRRAGTQGNTNAGNYIAGRFEEIELERINNGYAIPYNKKTDNIEYNKIGLEILEGENVVYRPQYGRDFFEKQLDDIDIMLPLALQPTEPGSAVLVENVEYLQTCLSDRNTRLIIYKNDTGLKRPSTFFEEKCIPQIKVSESVFAKLSEYVGKNIHLYADVDYKDITQYNIAGKISGVDNQHALLLSAHFDHLGCIGEPGDDNYMIWRGAFDNASGVAAMLEIAQRLRSIYKDEKPPCDIVFCAFNSEETLISGQSGSKYFLDTIREKYHEIYDINIDCIGDKGNSALHFYYGSDKYSGDIAEKLAANLKNQSISIDTEQSDNAASDHIVFEHSLWITSSGLEGNDIMHTVIDTADRVDTAYIAVLGEKIASGVKEIIQYIKCQSAENSEQAVQVIKTVKAEDMPSLEEFEKQFSCSIDFVDRSKIIGIDLMANPTLFMDKDQQSFVNSIEQCNKLSELRYVSIKMSDTAIDFSMYNKHSSIDMEFYKGDMQFNKYDDIDKALPVTVGDHIYHVFMNEEGFKSMICNYEDENTIIRVGLGTSDFDNFSKAEEYSEYFTRNFSEQFVDGIIRMLQQAFKENEISREDKIHITDYIV